MEFEQGERVTRYPVLWPGREVILRDAAVVVDVTSDAKRTYDEVGKQRRSDQSDCDVAVRACCRGVGPVLLALDNTVFHEVRQ